MEVWFVTCVTY